MTENSVLSQARKQDEKLCRAMAAELSELLGKVQERKTLRFSRCKTGYQWASVRTDSIETMHTLNWLWNHRQQIWDALNAIGTPK